MVKCRYYRVAGHTFSLKLEEQWLNQLNHYSPFAIDKDDISTTLFDLEISDFSTDSSELFYDDTNKDDMAAIAIYRHPNGWMVTLALNPHEPICAKILFSHDFHHVQLCILNDALIRFCVDNAAMLAFAFASCSLWTLEMHASVIRYKNQGFLFLGESGTGKSTHSQLWMKTFAEASLLNDDNPIVRYIDGQWLVFGSPWSGKTPCYINACEPISAFVLLQQAPENRISRLPLAQAYATLLGSSSGLKILPEMMDGLHQTIAKASQEIGIYHLQCLPNQAAAELCFHTTAR